MNNDFIIVYVTTANRNQAEEIAKTLVEEKLISCAHIYPVLSFFNWKGIMESDEEFRIVMKSRADLFDELSKRVKALHSYEVPEIIAVPIVAGWKDYLDWMQSVLK